MKIINININNNFYIITLIALVSYSITINHNLLALYGIKDNPNFNKDNFDDFNNNDLFKKIGDMEKKCKMLDNDINMLKTKNQDYKLKIEINKIYIKILYALIFIFLLIIFVVIIIKFYFQFHKKKSISKFYNLREKFDDEPIRERKKFIIN